jgi:hypothetical protein
MAFEQEVYSGDSELLLVDALTETPTPLSAREVV